MDSLTHNTVDYLAGKLSTPRYSESPIDIADDLRTEVERNADVGIKAGRWIQRSVINGYYEACKRIQQYQYHPDGEMKAPSDVSVQQAKFALLQMMVKGLRPPQPMLLAEGVVGAFWRRGEWYASINFEDDGEHLLAISDGKVLLTPTWRCQDELPPELINVAS